MQEKNLKTLFDVYREPSLFGRYIHDENIAPLFEKMKTKMQIAKVGLSVNGLSIHTITFGSGDKKILMWSQMHGNESTTTKAIFDMLNVFLEDDDEVKHIFQGCRICIIPILNPDGAQLYTRLNANEIDLNRDAQDLSQPESVILRKVFEDFKPDFCYNLHGQRTIFGAGNNDKSATVSFLAPAQDIETTVTPTRKIAMKIISVMNESLQKLIPAQVGIYDDSFNINCVGDTFQAFDVPTVLFEAGHYANDYNREFVRELIFRSLMVSLDYVASDRIKGDACESYFEIPQNKKIFFDVIIRNSKNQDIAIQFLEKLVNDGIVFVPKIKKISDLNDFFAHREIDANGYEVFGENSTTLRVGSEIDFVTIDNEKFSLKP